MTDTRKATPKLITVSAIRREKELMDQLLYRWALRLIEKRARRILLYHSALDEYVMGMGCWIFTKRNGLDDISTVYRERIPAYVVPFTRMMDAFDDMELKVTGESMRFTAHGPVVNAWGSTDGLDGEGVADLYALSGPLNG